MDWKSVIFSHWQMKLVCILLAFGLWFYVANEGFQAREIADGVTVKTINLSETLAVVDDLGEVKISVRPSSTTPGKDISAELFDAYVDTDGLGKGEYDLPIRVVPHDASIQVLRVEPSNLNVVLDDKINETFSVVPEIVGDPGEGYSVGEPELSAESVKIGGAESLVGTIKSVVAEVEVGGELSDVQKSVELKAINSNGDVVRNIYIDPKTVEVRVPISQEADVKSVGIKVVSEGEPKPGYFIKSLQSEPSAISLRGERDLLQEIEYISTYPVDLSGLSGGEEKIVELDLPDDVEADTNEVIVRIELEGSEVTKSVKAIFEFRNLGDGLNLGSFEPSKATVVVGGPSDVIESLTENDVRVIVDLAGRGSGTYSIPLSTSNVNTEDNISATRLNTSSIEVIIN